jgi:hypothetical protein
MIKNTLAFAILSMFFCLGCGSEKENIQNDSQLLGTSHGSHLMIKCRAVTGDGRHNYYGYGTNHTIAIRAAISACYASGQGCFPAGCVPIYY